MLMYRHAVHNFRQQEHMKNVEISVEHLLQGDDGDDGSADKEAQDDEVSQIRV